MNKLFAQRRQHHFMLLLKYWRLVFNDHFVIALFFLFGALAYGYSQWLPQLGPHLWWSRWLLAIWFTLLAQLGRLATLLERPDPVFLLPQVKNMQIYLRQARNYSLVLALLMTAAGTFVALPFALTTERLTTTEIVVIFLTFLIVKANWLRLAQLRISQAGRRHQQLLRSLQWLWPLVVALTTWLGTPMVGLILTIIFEIGILTRHLTLDWRLAVDSEADRMYSVYRFFNLFTDVPAVEGNIKRRTWANGLIKRLTITGHPWSYLYARGFIRNIDVSGIVNRLTLLAMVIAFLVPVIWLNSILSALFIYLIATQMMPLFDQYDGNVFTHLYPVSFAQRQADFQSLLIKITSLVAGLITLASLGYHLSWGQFGINLVIAVIEVLLLTRFYFQVRIKKFSEEN